MKKETILSAEEQQVRKDYIKNWGEKHGSERLKKQLLLGLTGEDLYKDERARLDFKAFEDMVAYMDGDDHFKIANPLEEHLDIAINIADRLVELGQRSDRVEAIQSVSICARNEEGEYGDLFHVTYILVTGYRPGKPFGQADLCFDVDRKCLE